jgi:hypothetical protein
VAVLGRGDAEGGRGYKGVRRSCAAGQGARGAWSRGFKGGGDLLCDTRGWEREQQGSAAALAWLLVSCCLTSRRGIGEGPGRLA